MAKRRKLPPGGELKQDYVLQWANDGKVGQRVKFSALFRKRDGRIFHFWGSEGKVDTVWPYWNLMDFTPEGRPDRPPPPQVFRSEFLEKYDLKALERV